MAALIPRGRAIQPETLVYAQSVVQSIDAEGRVGFTITANGTVAAQIDTELIRERLVGRNPTEALTYLKGEFDLQADSPPVISLSPEWMPQLPLLPFRIHVRLSAMTP
jgi:hypothetical protein